MQDVQSLAGSTSVEEAVRAADAAAAAAGVQIRMIDELEEIEAVHQLFTDIWRPAVEGSLMPTELLRALSTAGSYVSGAYDGTRLVGACVGLFGPPAERKMHSHIAGVSASVRRRGVGFALKQHQRGWARQAGVTTIAWTFDPLIATNARFNLAKLGARVEGYHPNFYGPMNDGFNAGQDSDRLLVHWQLDSPAVAAAGTGTLLELDPEQESAAGAGIALGRAENGRPVTGSVDAPTVLVALPTDLARMRAEDPQGVREWRVALRDTLTTLLTEGATVTGFARGGWYVVDRTKGTS